MTEKLDVQSLMRGVHERLTARENVLPAVRPQGPAADPEGRFYELRRNEAYNHHKYGAFGRELAVKRQGWKGRVETFFKRVVRKLLGWYVRPQVEFNASVTRAIAEATRHLEAIVSEQAALRDALQARLDAAELQLRVVNARLAELEKPPGTGISYHRFEARFRGEQSTIREAQRQYLPFFPAGPVLDVGCGRGEFLSLLREAGVEASGVDQDAGMAASARDQGLTVEVGDAFALLESLPDGSLSGLFSAQVVEHMTPERVQALFRLAYTKLRPGARLVAETPNMICEPAMRNFYLDPTHVRPLHPELLRFLGEEAGLRFETFVFTSAMPNHPEPGRHVSEQLDREDVSMFRDYAVVLVK